MKTGLVAFLDILGYKSFLEKTESEQIALQVIGLIKSIPAEATQEVSKAWHDGNLPGATSMPDPIPHLVFSDTIVLMLPFGEEWDEATKRCAFLYMVFACGITAARLFAKGLPVRGAMHEGEFIWQDTCLAGKAVREVQKLSESMELSSIVLTKALADARVTPVSGDNRGLFVEYLTPLKSAPEGSLWHINWYRMLPAGEKGWLADVEDYVLQSFWGYGKDVALSVDCKVRNTTKLIRKLRMAIDRGTSGVPAPRAPTVAENPAAGQSAVRPRPAVASPGARRA